MKNFKLLLYTQDEDGEESWTPFYLDADSILGFYEPVLEKHELLSINILLTSGFITILQEQHIADFLNAKFSKGLVI